MRTTIWTIWLALAVGAGVAATTNSPTVKPNAVAGKGGDPGLPIPQSSFTVPKTRSEGVDPFYPESSRLQGPVVVVPSTNKAPERAALAINGFSGVQGAMSVVINGKTFEVNQESEVNTPQGRVRVRCLDIRLQEGGAVVMAVMELNGERRELYFRRSK